MADGTRPAVFLDRDGTLTEDPGYLHRPEDVRVLPGAARAVARPNAAGYVVVVVTNQSGIARGYHTEEDFARVQARVTELLAAEGAHIDAAYHCPHAPDQEPRCECRKPGLKLYREAMRRLDIDPAWSWFIGDRLRDIEPARALGGQGLHVLTGARDEDEAIRRAGFDSVADLAAAVDQALAD